MGLQAQQIPDLLRREYEPWDQLEDLLGTFLGAALHESGSEEGAVHVRNFGSVVSNRRSSERIVGQLPANVGASTPIIYQEEPIGSVSWRSRKRRAKPRELYPFFQCFARELAFYIKRYEVKSWLSRSLGKDFVLVGTSSLLRRVEKHIEKSSEVDFPVLIEGEFGCEKLQTACAVHCNSHRRDQPFVEIKCGTQHLVSGADPKEWFHQADGGTLFFNGVDELDARFLAQLPEYLDSKVGQWLGSSAANDQPRVRVIASTTQCLDDQVREGQFPQQVLAELSFLKIRLPPLRDRREDIRPLIEHLFSKHRRLPGQRLSDGALRLFESHSWPENVFEVERLVARIAAMVGDREICQQDLHEHAPRLGKNESRAVSVPETLIASQASSQGREVSAPAPASSAQQTSVDELARRLAVGELGELKGFHIGLQRALKHIGEHYREEISLGALAGKSCVSPSYLCFLFKNHLGIPFKPFLGRVRVERAKQLLVEDLDLHITEISLEVGFGDLSHFERTFKRLVEVNPRAYRRQKLEEMATA